MNLSKITAASLLFCGLALGAGQAQSETINFGVSAPLSGTAAHWGRMMVWSAEQAAAQINQGGGIKVGGKTYQIKILGYDNKYSAQDGAKVAQEMIRRDGVKYIVGSMGAAPVRATQAISEVDHVVLFTGAWSNSIKGPKYPYTFSQGNTQAEILGPLYKYIVDHNAKAKSVFVINPNDATGDATEKEALRVWNELSVKVVGETKYERGATEFSPIATRIAHLGPAIVDLGSMPPGEAALLIKALAVQDWKGVKVVAAGNSVKQMAEIAGEALEGTYLGLAADFSGPLATDIQRKLQAAAGQEVPYNSIASWDAVMAVKAAAESANSLDPEKIKDVLVHVKFESSFGPSAFGRAEIYGAPIAMLLPVLVTQVEGGKVVERARLIPTELNEKLKP